jgi:hypothetical protein
LANVTGDGLQSMSGTWHWIVLQMDQYGGHGRATRNKPGQPILTTARHFLPEFQLFPPAYSTSTGVTVGKVPAACLNFPGAIIENTKA